MREHRLGLAEDKAEASIACRQTGPISFPRPLKRQDEMFSKRISLVFKRLRFVRMVDSTRNTLDYLTYSDRVIDGSPQNSVTAVPMDRGTSFLCAKQRTVWQPFAVTARASATQRLRSIVSGGGNHA